MKIFQFIHSIDKGGAETAMFSLHQSFLEKNFESKIITFKDTDIKDKNIITLNISKKSPLTPIKLNLFLKKEQPNLILLHLCDLHRLFYKINYPKIVNVVHLSLKHKYENKKIYLKHKFFKQIQKTYNKHTTVFVSKYLKDETIHFFNLSKDNKYTIYNPFDFEKIKTLANSYVVEEKNYILFIGRLEKIKNPLLAIEAFKYIKNKNISLIFLGEGSLKNNLIKYVKDNNLQHKIKFLGFKRNPYPYIKYAKVVVSTSYSEVLPSILIESLILKTPIVSTENLGAKEIMIDELKIFLTPFEPKIIASKIESAINNYPSITNKYIKRFNKDIIINKYINLIKG